MYDGASIWNSYQKIKEKVNQSHVLEENVFYKKVNQSHVLLFLNIWCIPG